MTLETAKNKVKKLIDEYSTRGAVTSPSDLNIADYELKMSDYFDIAQKEIATVKNIRKVNKITQFLPENKLNNGFYEEVKEGDKLEYKAIGKAYYFEVSGEAEIKITSGEETITVNNEGLNYETYYGSFDESAEIKISFNSDYLYAIRNVAIFAVSNTNYSSYIKYPLPTDSLKIFKVSLNGKDFDHYFMNDSLYVAWQERGEIVMEYAALPSVTDDDYEFEIANELQEAMCFYVAALLIQSENPNMFSILYSQYQSKLANAEVQKYPAQTRIKRVYY